MTGTDETHCRDCGCELTKRDIESGAVLCYGCFTWYSDYAELEAEDKQPL